LAIKRTRRWAGPIWPKESGNEIKIKLSVKFFFLFSSGANIMGGVAYGMAWFSNGFFLKCLSSRTTELEVLLKYKIFRKKSANNDIIVILLLK